LKQRSYSGILWLLPPAVRTALAGAIMNESEVERKVRCHRRPGFLAGWVGFFENCEKLVSSGYDGRRWRGANVGQFSAAHFSQKTREMGHPPCIFGGCFTKLAGGAGHPPPGASVSSTIRRFSAMLRRCHRAGHYGTEDSIDESQRRIRHDLDLRRKSCTGRGLQDQRNVLSVEAGSGAGHDQHYRQRLLEAAGDRTAGDGQLADSVGRADPAIETRVSP